MLSSVNILINGETVKEIDITGNKPDEIITVNIDGDIFNNINKYREFKEGLKILLEKCY